MDYRQKRVIATCVLAAGGGLMFWGFGRMWIEAFSGHVRLFTQIVFFGSAVVGVIAAICRTYWGQMQKREDAGQKAAIEALAALGRQSMDEKQRKAGN